MPTNSIDSINFVDISPMPELIGQNTLVESRPGVDGHNLWLTGSRGQGQTVTTFADMTNIAAGVAAMTAYKALVGSRVAIVWADQALPKKYDILNVQLIELKATVGGVGGLNGTSSAVLVASWTIMVTDEAIA